MPTADPRTTLQQVLLPSMLIALNYITVLIETESAGKLQQALQLKRRVYDTYHQVSEAQREKLAQGLVSAVKEIPVFPYSSQQGQAQGQGQVLSVRTTLNKVVDEMEQYLEYAAQRAALEAEEELRRRLLEEEESLNGSSVKEDNNMPLVSALRA